MIESVLAASEVIGRHVVERVPVGDLRARVGRWARRPSTDPPPTSLDDVGGALRALGLESGRDWIVHSSWAGMTQLKSKPGDVVAWLRGLAGERSTLVMPAHGVEKEQDGAIVYDVDKTPSRMGMLSESFRRTAGALRSPVPVAPVAALGPDAARYTRDYRAESDRTPWGKGSPWWEIGERAGQVVVLGVDFVRTLTLMHVAFDVLGDDNPIADYYEELDYQVTQKGASERWRMKRQRRSLERNLATVAFSRLVLKSGTVRAASINGLKIAVVDARRFLDWHLPIARATGLPYWGFSRRR